jgi:predicted acyltransferase
MKRVQAIDVLRGMTLALMVLVNLPGSWSAVYPMLAHSAWNGMTPTDFIFPNFVFVMGVSMFFSLRKQNFTLSWKMLKRFLLLLAFGLLINIVNHLVYGTEGIRFTGVLARFALCFGASALIICKVNHKYLPWVIVGILVGYSALLLLGNGYEYGPDNILSRVDRAVLGKHMYNDHGIDPEGLLSTLPAIANTLIGFLVGKILASEDFRKMDSLGTAMLLVGLLLDYLLPMNKKVWSPSFVLVVCGLGTLLLSLLHYIIDERGWWKHTGFFKVFGTNAIYCYLMSDVITWIYSLTGFGRWAMGLMGVTRGTSLLFAVFSMLVVYLMALPLYKRKIFLKL